MAKVIRNENAGEEGARNASRAIEQVVPDALQYIPITISDTDPVVVPLGGLTRTVLVVGATDYDCEFFGAYNDGENTWLDETEEFEGDFTTAAAQNRLFPVKKTREFFFVQARRVNEIHIRTANGGGAIGAAAIPGYLLIKE